MRFPWQSIDLETYEFQEVDDEAMAGRGIRLLRPYDMKFSLERPQLEECESGL